jgi:hypothetical protein
MERPVLRKLNDGLQGVDDLRSGRLVIRLPRSV